MAIDTPDKIGSVIASKSMGSSVTIGVSCSTNINSGVRISSITFRSMPVWWRCSSNTNGQTFPHCQSANSNAAKMCCS